MDCSVENDIDRLLSSAGFQTPQPGANFVQAVNCCRRQLLERFPQYAQFTSDRSSISASQECADLEDVDRLPALFLPALKRFRFAWPQDLQVEIALTSTGTSGSPSEVPLDNVNLQRRIAAMRIAYEDMGLLSESTTVLAFLLDPQTTRMAGSVIIDGVLRSHPHVQAVTYLARMTDTGPQFDVQEAVDRLTSAADSQSVLIVGYPALISSAILQMQQMGITTVPLPTGSLVLTGGGWKSTLPGVPIDQQEFSQMAAAFFGTPRSSIRDMFGLSECPAVFLQCALGNYHIPAFAWAQAVDPETQSAVPDGQLGLLQITTPLSTSYPLLRVLTTDKVCLGRHCDCGFAAPFLQPHGRTSVARFETCAMRIGQAVN